MRSELLFAGSLGQLIMRLELLVRGQHQCLAKLGSFWQSGLFWSLVRVPRRATRNERSGMRASAPRRGVFLQKPFRATGTAEEKRLHAVNWTLKTCLQPYLYSFRAS